MLTKEEFTHNSSNVLLLGTLIPFGGGFTATRQGCGGPVAREAKRGMEIGG